MNWPPKFFAKTGARPFKRTPFFKDFPIPILNDAKSPREERVGLILNLRGSRPNLKIIEKWAIRFLPKSQPLRVYIELRAEFPAMPEPQSNAACLDAGDLITRQTDMQTDSLLSHASVLSCKFEALANIDLVFRQKVKFLAH